MKSVYSDRHRLHDSGIELFGGKLVPCFETPERADIILAEIKRRGIGEVVAPQVFDEAYIAAVHSPAYVIFLKNVWAEWAAAGGTDNILPNMSPARGMRHDRVPKAIYAKACYYSLDSTTAITKGTWAAARSSADVALTAQGLIGTGAKSAFALCRPPGHHAAADYFGGYCFFNNAAIAAQAFRDRGAAKVAILDVDYHHGNGTQSIFYDRPDVYVTSLHGDPAYDYPSFLGYADEQGRGAGEGFNANYPLPQGTDAKAWFATLQMAMEGVRRFGPEVLVVSLGVDTYAGDPISHFKLQTTDFLKMGETLATLRLPTLFVMEGGYAVEDLGVNAVNVLEGFESKGG